jgi:poly-gamma-glutamate capsule biosynthesis protein CapA/YwtB (metallophosphatase superfamily)
VNAGSVKLFLCGDVMTGRGIDQILRHPSDPRIYEGYVKNAIDYVRLAERASGAVPRDVDDAYIWGDALEELAHAKPHARIINLETAVTRSDDWTDKGINYRMHPANVDCLTAAGTDCCTLANNHVLDWGEGGLVETLETLRAAGLRTAGAGRNRDEAQAPAELGAPGARLLVYSLGMRDSGIPPSWEATATRPGIDFLAELSARAARQLAERVQAARRPGDLVLVSLHWGGNWGYRVPREQIDFAHELVDSGAADLVHGHSSHHPKAAEIYRSKLILYGCGDFINDYEGISGHEEFRGDLGVMYFPTLAGGSGELLALELVALCRRRLRLERAPEIDCQWLCGVLNAEGERFGSSFDLRPRSRFAAKTSRPWVPA